MSRLSILARPLLGVVLTAAAAPLAAQESPAAIVRAEVTRVLDIVQDTSLNASTKRERLRQRFAASFDFAAMSQSILAVHWAAFGEADRARFVERFPDLLEALYLDAIAARTTEIVRVGGERIEADRATVIVTIERQSGGDIPLLFKLKRADPGWRVYDANIEGLSLVRHYRERFDEVARRDGASGVLAELDRLIEARRKPSA